MPAGAQALPGGTTIAWLRTLLAKGPRPLRREHLHHRPASARLPRLHVIALDTSGSMRRGGRLALAKGHAARLIEHAAAAGDDTALLCFGGGGVELVLPPGRACLAGSARVQRVGGGGGTPLAQALAQAGRLLRAGTRRNAGECWLWLLTDGRTLEQPVAPKAAHIVIIDFDDPTRPLGRCAAWAALWGADHRPAASSAQ